MAVDVARANSCCLGDNVGDGVSRVVHDGGSSGQGHHVVGDWSRGRGGGGGWSGGRGGGWGRRRAHWHGGGGRGVHWEHRNKRHRAGGGLSVEWSIGVGIGVSVRGRGRGSGGVQTSPVTMSRGGVVSEMGGLGMSHLRGVSEEAAWCHDGCGVGPSVGGIGGWVGVGSWSRGGHWGRSRGRHGGGGRVLWVSSSSGGNSDFLR